jgi:hypothetical protein
MAKKYHYVCFTSQKYIGEPFTHPKIPLMWFVLHYKIYITIPFTYANYPYINITHTIKMG